MSFGWVTKKDIVETRMVLGSKFDNDRPRGHQDYDWSMHLERRPSPNYGVLVLSKSTSAEALQAVWTGTTKHLIEPRYPRGTISSVSICCSVCSESKDNRAKHSASDHQQVAHVMRSSHKPSHNIFPQIEVVASYPSGHLLQQTTSLKILEPGFPSPYQTKSIGSRPWYDVLQTLNKHFSPFPFIKHVPNVVRAGAIKTVIANKWNYILTKEYLERHLETRSHEYDWGEAMQAIQDIPEAALPLKCNCALLCVPSGTTSDPSVDYTALDADNAYVLGRPWDPNGRLAKRKAQQKHRLHGPDRARGL
ncbi:hypothetical protein EK21DRAFT_83407 [Setomelanomma holmii]|uniref:Uncharacterized protein n=1 Tax=Setomelanomma holmii TaxID=210430 RepID=A0A9P4HLY3_9PLEO|nr:hypothetical protein EK21DRAFT_83407 [Setomelanomma holmii]